MRTAMDHDNSNQRYEKKDIRKVVTTATIGDPEPGSGTRGFTLIEILVVVAILGILTVIAMSVFERAKQIAKVSRCESEIRTLEKNIIAYYTDKGVLPDSLSRVSQGDLRDPWGNLYQYVNIANTPAMALKDSMGQKYNINSDAFDLYSKGPDGDSDPLFTNPKSKDDIIRGGDGQVVSQRYP